MARRYHRRRYRATGTLRLAAGADAGLPFAAHRSLSRDPPMKSVDLIVRNPSGLHARPAALFAETATRFGARITVQKLDRGGPAGRGRAWAGDRQQALETAPDFSCRGGIESPDGSPGEAFERMCTDRTADRGEARRRHAQLTDAQADEAQRGRRIARHLPAHRQLDPGRLRFGDRLAHEAQERRMQGVLVAPGRGVRSID